MRYFIALLVIGLALPAALAGPCAGEGNIMPAITGLDVQLDVTLNNPTCVGANANDFFWLIDWGDGSTPYSATTGNPDIVDVPHTYSAAGTYDITVEFSVNTGGQAPIIPDDTFTSQLTVSSPGAPPPPGGDPTGGGTGGAPPPPPPPSGDPSNPTGGGSNPGQCPVSQCSALTTTCDCGATQASPGQFCYAPGDVRSSAGSCNFQLTNALAAGGSINLCGPIWRQPIPEVQLNNLCNRIQTLPGSGIGYNYTCSANASGWFWYPETGPVPSIDKSNTAQYAHVQPYLSSTQASWNAIACVNGQPTQAVTKYSPPPTLTQGSCSILRCFDGTGCVDPGSVAENHVCTSINGEAWWVSGSVRAANAVLQYKPSSDYLLNCGPKEFGVNKQVGTDDTLAFCQLARLSGVDADRIVVAVAMPVGVDGTDYDSIIGSLRTELERMHDPSDLDCLDDDPESCAFLEYDATENAIVFTNENSLTPGVFTRVWDSLTSIFSSSSSPQLQSKAASKIYVNTDQSIERAVEYVSGTSCTSGQEILGTGNCFTEDGWRQEIQTR